jgi:hypothetical protein
VPPPEARRAAPSFPEERPGAPFGRKFSPSTVQKANASSIANPTGRGAIFARVHESDTPVLETRKRDADLQQTGTFDTGTQTALSFVRAFGHQ